VDVEGRGHGLIHSESECLRQDIEEEEEEEEVEEKRRTKKINHRK
jgi:hypothetical protein